MKDSKPGPLGQQSGARTAEPPHLPSEPPYLPSEPPYLPSEPLYLPSEPPYLPSELSYLSTILIISLLNKVPGTAAL